MNSTAKREVLWASTSYRKLDNKHRLLATRIICDDQSLGQACRGLGLNQTREKNNFDLQVCLAEHQGATVVPTEPGALQRFDTPRDEVVAAYYSLVDYLRDHGSFDGWAGASGISDDATYAAELVAIENGDKLRPCPKASVPDPQKVAVFVAEMRRYLDEYVARMAPIKQRHAAACAEWEAATGKPWPWKMPTDKFERQLAATACSACSTAIAERQDRHTVGKDTLCLSCHESWRRTGEVTK